MIPNQPKSLVLKPRNPNRRGAPCLALRANPNVCTHGDNAGTLLAQFTPSYAI